ncbi:MAG: hypothetical protein EOO68_08530 [Moraxellaceae bacterium]|nr:MAG: hypothetical protein EOO68_08530 [Moraxellaceae bacterium]
MHVRNLQQALTDALQREDWPRVRQLDQTCAVLIDKVISANKGDRNALVLALSELKGVYSRLILKCQHEVASIGR